MRARGEGKTGINKSHRKMGTKTRPSRGEKEKKREKRQARVNETGSLYHAVPHSTLSVLPSLGHVLGSGGWKAGW